MAKSETGKTSLEQCDHLQADADRPAYGIVVALGDNRVLQLCLACGKSFQADIMAAVLEKAVKAHMAEHLRRSLGIQSR